LGPRSRLLYSEISADPSGEVFVDLAMPRNGGGEALDAVDVDGMTPALSKKLTAFLFEMTDQIDPLTRAVPGAPG
jgi:hypothetical protein